MVSRKGIDCLQQRHPMTRPCHAAVQPCSVAGPVAGRPARAHIWCNRGAHMCGLHATVALWCWLSVAVC
jgi:hypothetical protein